MRSQTQNHKFDIKKGNNFIFGFASASLSPIRSLSMRFELLCMHLRTFLGTKNGSSRRFGHMFPLTQVKSMP